MGFGFGLRGTEVDLREKHLSEGQVEWPLSSGRDS